MAYLSEYDVPALRRLLSVALRQGISAESLLLRLKSCVDQLYSPRSGFSKRDFDLAFIAKSLGGPRLLYAFQHAFGLPSTSTLARQSPLPELRPCLGTPSVEDVEYSIQTMFGPGVHEPPPTESLKKSGMVLMLDGVAIEEVCRYCNQRDTVLGLCREHAKNVKPVVSDYEALQAIEDAFNDGQVHIGKDATVVALASLTNPDDYIAIPVLISPSCKAETGNALAGWLQIFLDVWKTHPSGEALHGPIVTIASDGESTFRAARFQLAMSQKVNTETGYGQILQKLCGLNLQCGLDGVLATCDPRHIFKRKSLFQLYN
ncbi:hypothetical protein F5051DRAFT_381541 [Lentinula edodes]|nr:hypothetical protein F5051DRAFT_381541 [Lentinula edodes]